MKIHYLFLLCYYKLFTKCLFLLYGKNRFLVFFTLNLSFSFILLNWEAFSLPVEIFNHNFSIILRFLGSYREGQDFQYLFESYCGSLNSDQLLELFKSALHIDREEGAIASSESVPRNFKQEDGDYFLRLYLKDPYDLPLGEERDKITNPKDISTKPEFAIVRAIAEAIASYHTGGESPSNNVIIIVKYIYHGNLNTLERIPIGTNFTTTSIFERGGLLYQRTGGVGSPYWDCANISPTDPKDNCLSLKDYSEFRRIIITGIVDPKQRVTLVKKD